VPPGGATAYQDVPGVRRVVRIDAVSALGDHILQPYDDVGEEPLPPGRYTFEVGLINGSMTLKVVTDSPDDGSS